MLSWQFEELVSRLEQGDQDRYNRVREGDWMIYNAHDGDPALLAYKGHLVASGSDIEALRENLKVAIEVANRTIQDMSSHGSFTCAG